MKTKLFILTLFVLAIVFAVYSAVKTDEFKPAEDFPRGALIYAQVNDLPQFIKLWNESKLKENFLASGSFEDLQNRHLGRKLASRWQEFSDAAGFPIDLETIAGLSENRAAIALYDAGKLEFVFVAPVSEEIFAATVFVQNQNKFAEETLEDGTKIYRAAVEADRGRQKQNLIFANLKGRFVLATSEKLLAQTLNNINGDNLKNRLSDDVSFKTLSEKTATHLATVWVDQTALNDDYYFKHYWLMSDVKNLKNIRAGIFDLEMQAGKLIENRRFLLSQSINAAPVEHAQAAKMLAFLPENIPFYKLETANPKTADEAVKQTFFDRSLNEPESSSTHYFYDAYDFSDGDSSDDDGYYYLSEDYNEMIDDDDENAATARKMPNFDFGKILQTANPQSVLTFTRPRVLPAPLFVQFDRAAIFQIANAQNFNQNQFESELARQFAAQTMISGAKAEFDWETKTENNVAFRRLKPPMLEWQIAYAVFGNDLILTNDADFLREIAAAENHPKEKTDSAAFNELTVINIDEKPNAYDEVFSRLAEKNVATGDAFWDDVSGFLDIISDVRKIEIRKNYSQNIFEENLTFFITPNDADAPENDVDDQSTEDQQTDAPLTETHF